MLSSLAIMQGGFSTPATDAAAMLAKMSLVEKVTLLHGKGGTLGARCPHLTMSMELICHLPHTAPRARALSLSLSQLGTSETRRRLSTRRAACGFHR